MNRDRRPAPNRICHQNIMFWFLAGSGSHLASVTHWINRAFLLTENRDRNSRQNVVITPVPAIGPRRNSRSSRIIIDSSSIIIISPKFIVVDKSNITDVFCRPPDKTNNKQRGSAVSRNKNNNNNSTSWVSCGTVGGDLPTKPTTDGAQNDLFLYHSSSGGFGTPSDDASKQSAPVFRYRHTDGKTWSCAGKCLANAAARAFFRGNTGKLCIHTQRTSSLINK
jgi:hypothetical protein